ncbi:MAG: hypothetical protein U0V56_09800 [Actinomycetota bacterium]
MTRLQEAGAIVGAKNGVERPGVVVPGEPWRRAGADQAWGGLGAAPYTSGSAASAGRCESAWACST